MASPLKDLNTSRPARDYSFHPHDEKTLVNPSRGRLEACRSPLLIPFLLFTRVDHSLLTFCAPGSSLFNADLLAADAHFDREFGSFVFSFMAVRRPCP